VKATVSTRASSDPAASAPPNVPATTPGVNFSITPQLTDRRWWWLRTLDAEVKMMVAIPVPSARWTMCSGAKPLAEKMNARTGTSAEPPPMPSSPLKKPTKAPSAR